MTSSADADGLLEAKQSKGRSRAGTQKSGVELSTPLIEMNHF
jgi:hypothetical protein